MLKNYRFVNTVVLLLLVGIVSSCQQTTDLIPADDSVYYPLETGDYWIYQVTQENYSLTKVATKRVFQLQEKVGSSFTRNGQLFFQVEESTRKSEQADWQISAIRTVYKNLSEVVSQDNNVPLVNLTFPISVATTWNVNTYNARPDTLLRYQAIGQPFALSKRTVGQTISVVGSNDSTLVNAEKYRRVYAPNVGLIYREDASLAYCQSSSDCIGKGIIASGTKQTWALITSNRLP